MNLLRKLDAFVARHTIAVWCALVLAAFLLALAGAGHQIEQHGAAQAARAT